MQCPGLKHCKELTTIGTVLLANSPDFFNTSFSYFFVFINLQTVDISAILKELNIFE